MKRKECLPLKIATADLRCCCFESSDSGCEIQERHCLETILNLKRDFNGTFVRIVIVISVGRSTIS